MPQLQAPDGTPIVGTKEIIPGVAQIDPNSSTPGNLVYVGETDVDWDGQETVMRDGQRVFIDEGNDEWLENELRLVRRYAVTLVAHTIQVTANNQTQASRYARADAEDFNLGWDVEHVGTSIADDSYGDPDVETDVVYQDHEGDTWTYDATHVVYIDAVDETEALKLAVEHIKAKLV